MYFIGLFVMTIGIALSVKSNLGVSPVSSIPYTTTCVWGIEMGKATILFHMVLVLIQILLLRKKFKPVQLLQVLVGVVFGYFTTFCNYMVSFLPTPENLGIRIIMVLASTVFVAFGIFLYLPANLIPLAGEGCMQAVSSVTHIEFSKVKIGFDCTMVLVSAITCLTVLHNLGSVGAGTIIAAILVGTLVGIINRAFGKQRDKLLGKTVETAASSAESTSTSNYVITISREFGSGGREIGKILAEQFGFHYYDSELIRLAAEKRTGLEKPCSSRFLCMVCRSFRTKRSAESRSAFPERICAYPRTFTEEPLYHCRSTGKLHTKRSSYRLPCIHQCRCYCRNSQGLSA